MKQYLFTIKNSGHITLLTTMAESLSDAIYYLENDFDTSQEYIINIQII